MDVNRERLAANFIELCEIDSPSRREGRISRRLQELFRDMGATEIIEDDSSAQTGSECGNLIIRFDGTLPLTPIFFSCHMDTVQPAEGVRVKRSGDLFTSAGDTILGSDDKSGIAACIEALRLMRENGTAHRPVELVITTCEEIGLIGAKALDPALVRAKEGYALDSSGFARVVTHAPALNRVYITINGVAAHAGLHPEWGVNAMILAGQALAKVRSGRIDEETTVNFGTISGGTACNIVPERVMIEAEVRSHSLDKLERVTEEIREIFNAAIAAWSDPTGSAKGVPSVNIEVRQDFSVMGLSPDNPVLRRVEAAARSIGMELSYEKAGGGSDANIFNGHGLATAIIATGMTNVHSTSEQVELQDMVDLTRLLIALLTEPSC
ncbi:peptidase T-like protein [Desulfobulbus propionicus DSM 2032]|uniref:Peptidase T-like protein n=1 Tax=Desulfobulbus propionicus (strain ATCC 33891 / DSM 2032 / VKM B-1956 / 1pr3) TaxID=577650 RepID=A0A7U3YNX2_DESPD|nr:M20/M25/M40 family metallo-hydrolase [Desulfobulbus propionicus]ADW18854.1 peptidase T-like protein [Desulfobulbus propionicus DSM 2032]